VRALTGRRETDDGVTVLSAELPVVVSVSEKINEPRYPSFKGIMAAKKKPVASLTLADVGGALGGPHMGQRLTTTIAHVGAEDVDRAGRFLRGVDERADGRRVADVAGDSGRGSTLPVQPLCSALRPFGLQVRDDDAPRPGPGEAPGQGEADSVPAARDDDGGCGEVHGLR
jgi:hypothetical protein